MRSCRLTLLMIFTLVQLLFVVFSLALFATNFTSAVSKTVITSSESLQYSLIVAGLDSASTVQPKLPPFSGFKLTNSRQSSSFSFANGKSFVTKTYVYTLKPLRGGVLTIGPAILKDNETVSKTSPITIKVTGEVPVSAPTQIPKKVTKTLPPVSVPKVIEQHKISDYEKDSVKPMLWLIIIHKLEKRIYFWSTILGLVFASSYALLKYRSRIKSDVRLSRLKQAKKVAHKHLKKAQGYLDVKCKKAFYSAINKAIIDYVGHKFNIEVTGLTQKQLKEALHNQNIADLIFEEFQVILDKCDYARFAPTQIDKAEMSQILSETQKLIVDIENNS